MTQESQLELETGSSESSPPSHSESSAQSCQTLTLDLRDLHQDPPARRRAGRPEAVLSAVRRGQGETDRLCSPSALGYARRCYASVTAARSGGTSAALRRGRWCDTLPSGWVRTSTSPCQRTKAEHCGPRSLLHPLPLPSRRGGMIGVDRIAGLPTTAAGFDMIQNHVDLLSGKVHAVPTRSTATAADAAAIIRDLCLRSGDGFPDVLVVVHYSKFTSEVFQASATRCAHMPMAARLPPAARCFRHQQCGVDALRRADRDALLRRPRRALGSPSRRLATAPPLASHLHTTRSGCG